MPALFQGQGRIHCQRVWMALLGDGEGRYEISSYDCHFRGMSKLLKDYGIVHLHSFESLFGFKEICKNFFADLMEGDKEGKSQYLGFMHVRMSDISCIDEIRSEIPKTTILYDSVEEVLILKFMVGVIHETCTSLLQGNFFEAVRVRVGHIYSMYGLKSARFKGGQRMKEPDDSFKPRSTGSESDWPSIVFEVGVSKQLTQLRLDARFWLECSGEQTRIVIVASVDRSAGTIVIERWQGAPTLQPPRNMNNPNPYVQQCIPTRMQSLTLQRGQYYAGEPLIIPAFLVFDVLPLSQGAQWLVNDFEISVHMLNMMNEMFWDGLN